MTRRLLSLLLAFLLTGVLAELVLRALPVSSGYRLGAVNDAEPILRGKPHSAYTYSRGWNLRLANSGVLNNDGFRASYDFSRNPDSVVLLGNSFVQADAIDPRDTVAERLQSLLARPTYGIGVDGFSLADYLAAARWSIDTFDARTVLVLVTTGDLKHACTPRSGQHYLRTDGAVSLALVDRPEPSRTRRALSESRLYRYVFDNLRVSANWAKGWRRENDVEPDPNAGAGATATGGGGCANATDSEAVTRFLLDGFHALVASRHATVIFVLAPGYRKEQGVAAGGERDVDVFADRAEQAGFHVVRLDAAFETALKANTRLDFMPIDGHWNAAANALAAHTVADELSVPRH